MSLSAQQFEVKSQQIKTHVQKYSQPNNLQALKALLMTALVEAMAIILIRVDSFQISVVGWVVHSLCSVRLFVQFHDMAHFSFFESMRTNEMVGHVLGVWLHFPFKAWRDGHNHHHKHFGNLDRVDLSQTILFTHKQYMEMAGIKRFAIRVFRDPFVFFFFSSPFVWFIGLVPVIIKRYGIFSIQFAQKILSLLLFLVILPMFGVPRLPLCLAIYGTNLFGTAMFHLQHSVNIPYREHRESWSLVGSALLGSTYLPTAFPLSFFTNGIEYHHIHHLNTNISSYNIKKCHDDLGDEAWKAVGVNYVGWKLAAQSMVNVMLKEEDGQIIGFGKQ